MRVGVLLAGLAVRGPTGVANTATARHIFGRNCICKARHLASAAHHIEHAAVCLYGNAGGIVPAVFELAQPLDDDVAGALRTGIADDSTHMKTAFSRLLCS